MDKEDIAVTFARQLNQKDTLLAEKDEEIASLEERIEHLQNQIYAFERKIERVEDSEQWGWRNIRTLKNSAKGWDDFDVPDTNMGLPTPRLEIRWHRESEYDRIADYGLVTEHLLGHIMFIPIGRTRQSGARAEDFGRYCATKEEKDLHFLDTPFRDGAHLMHDAKRLRLPAYVTNPARNIYRQVHWNDESLLQAETKDIVYYEPE